MNESAASPAIAGNGKNVTITEAALLHSQAAQELSQKRQTEIAERAKMAQTICSMLTMDAIRLEELARLEQDKPKMHRMMDTARGIRVTIGWLRGEGSEIK